MTEINRSKSIDDHVNTKLVDTTLGDSSIITDRVTLENISGLVSKLEKQV